jgi:hypothetical protein
VKDLFSSKQYAVKSIDKKYLKETENGMLAFESEVNIMRTLCQENKENN